MRIQKCSRYDPCQLLLQMSQNHHDGFKKNGLKDILIGNRIKTTINLNSLLDKSVMLVTNWLEWEWPISITFFRLEQWSSSFRSDTHVFDASYLFKWQRHWQLSTIQRCFLQSRQRLLLPVFILSSSILLAFSLMKINTIYIQKVFRFRCSKS